MSRKNRRKTYSVKDSRGMITGMFYTNVITDNITLPDGSVENSKKANADEARSTSEIIRL